MGVFTCAWGYKTGGCGWVGRRGFIKPLLPPPPKIKLSLTKVVGTPRGLPFGEPEEFWVLPLLLLLVRAWSMSSRPALVWKRLLRFTTLGEVWVRTVTGPKVKYQWLWQRTPCNKVFYHSNMQDINYNNKLFHYSYDHERQTHFMRFGYQWENFPLLRTKLLMYDQLAAKETCQCIQNLVLFWSKIVSRFTVFMKKLPFLLKTNNQMAPYAIINFISVLKVSTTP